MVKREQNYFAREETVTNEVMIHATLDIEFVLRRRSKHALLRFVQTATCFISVSSTMTNPIVMTLLILSSTNFRNRCTISYKRKRLDGTYNLLSTDAFSAWFIRMIWPIRQIPDNEEIDRLSFSVPTNYFTPSNPVTFVIT